MITFVRYFVLLIGITFSCICCNSYHSAVQFDSAKSDSIIEKGFMAPPDSVKPWCYWYWISGNISKDGITKDLEAMARVGIGEAFIGNINMGKYNGKISVLTDEWWALTEHAIREGKRVGVDIGIFNSPGWSQSGGPWVKSSQAMRYLIYSDTVIDGGRTVRKKLATAADTAQDVAVIAFKKPQDDYTNLVDLNPLVSTIPAVTNAALLADHDLLQPVEIKSKEFTIDLSVKENFTARTLVIYPSKSPFMANVRFQAWQNGAYQTVKTFLFDRSNNEVNVGPMLNAPVAIALPEVSATKFRLIFDNIKGKDPVPGIAQTQANAGLTEVSLLTAPRLEKYVEKQLGKMFPTPLPLWEEYQWPLQQNNSTAAMRVNKQTVVNITSKMQPDGTLVWDAPPGQWVVMRFGVVPTGTKNSPASPEATGFEVDKMNKDHLASHFDAYVGKILRDMPAEDRTAFKHVVADSYEMGSQNYTEGFARDFKKRYGYDPLNWLPVLSGRIIGSADQSDRFLWDLRRFVADKVAYEYVGGLRDLSQKNGLRVWLENYGHWGFPSEFLMYGGQSNDIGGEFWTEGTLGNVECRAASSAAHIYGINRVYAESFTGAGNAFSYYPERLKKRGDWSFTEGVNHVVLHVYIHQPYEDKEPGMNAWFGTEFNRKNTWFDQSKTWFDYLRRNMFMLQQGKAVNDVCYFIGEDAPKMTGIRDPELPNGYSYDYVNAEVIMKRMSVKDGKLILPDGMSYRLLVLPKLATMRPELAKKIKELVKAGAAILGPKPTRSPSMENFPQADKDVQQIASELWGAVNGTTVTSASYGKGLIMAGMDMKSALAQIKITPDVAIPGNPPVLWAHRQVGGMDIYFLTNQTDNTITINPTFRVSGKQPELWDATTGRRRLLPQHTAQNNGTTIPLKMLPTQSCFIVFRHKVSKDLKGDNFPDPVVLQTIKTPWQVQFDPAKRGPQKPVLFNTLTDWSENADEAIRYYSGSAVYKNSFQLTSLPARQHLLLSLSAVKNMARIKINGKDVGGLWTNPWQVDITDAVVKGKNEVEIEVVNLWVNRLIGDSKLAPAERKTWLVSNPFKPGDKLQPSGLIGDVKLVTLPGQ